MHARTSFGFGADPGGVPPEPALGAFRQVLADHCAQFNSQQVVQLPAAASLELVRTLALSVRRSLKQIVPLTAASEPESPFAHLVCRELASRLTVQRIYLVTPDGTDSETLDGRLDADQRDALDARLVPAADDPTFPLRNTWLVDDSIVVHEDFTDDGAPAWTIDSRSDTVSRGISLWEKLWGSGSQFASGGAYGSGGAAVRRGAAKDPLLVSADQIASMAPMSCASTPDEPDSCAWYHGMWQYLRLLDMVPVPAWHGDFFVSSIGRALRGHGGAAAPRVLISGAADYALLGETLRAIGRVAQETTSNARVAVLDRCRTPLIACRWYARQTNTEVDLHEMDVRRAPELLAGHPRFDVIATDTFLTKFPVEEVPGVLAAWRALAAPGAHVITTIRLCPMDIADDDPLDEVLGFAGQVRDRAERWRWLLRASVDDIVRGAEQYVRRARSTNLGSPAAIGALFEEAGFELVDTDVQPTRGALRPTTSLRVVARAS